MKFDSALTRRDALRIMAGAGLVVSCGGEVDQGAAKTDGGAPHPPGVVNLSASLGWPTVGIVMDDETIYVADVFPPLGRARDEGTIVGIARTGGVVRTIATGQIEPSYLSLDGENLFWVTSDGGTPGLSTVQQISRAGGAVRAFTTTNGRVIALSANGGTLAYILEASGPDSPNGRLFVGYDGQIPTLVDTASLRTSDPLYAARDSVHWGVLRDPDSATQIFGLQRGSSEPVLVLDGLPRADLLDDRAVYLGAEEDRIRFYDGRVEPLPAHGTPMAVHGQRVATAGYSSVSRGITLVDTVSQASQPLFPLDNAILSMCVDDKGVAWLEKIPSQEDSEPPALFYYPFPS